MGSPHHASNSSKFLASTRYAWRGCITTFEELEPRFVGNDRIHVIMYSPFCGRMNNATKQGKLLDDLLEDDGLEFKRLANLKKKIVAGYEILGKDIEINSDKEIAIFVAPEWYFRKKDRPYKIDEMEFIVLELLSFSKSFVNLIIVPGSIYWGIQGKNWLWEVYNCCPVICQGQLLSLVHKIGEADIDKDKRKIEIWGMHKDGKFSEAKLVRINQKMAKMFSKYIPNTDDDFFEGMFKFNKLQFGLEICRDHVEERLLKYHNNRSIDVHILSSCGSAVSKKSASMKTGGYILNCDGVHESHSTNYAECTSIKKCCEKEIKGIRKSIFNKFICYNNKTIYTDTEEKIDVEKFDSIQHLLLFEEALEFQDNDSISETNKSFLE